MEKPPVTLKRHAQGYQHRGDLNRAAVIIHGLCYFAGLAENFLGSSEDGQVYAVVGDNHVGEVFGRLLQDVFRIEAAHSIRGVATPLMNVIIQALR